MCAVPRKRKFPELSWLREALDAEQDFLPFRLAEARGYFPSIENASSTLPGAVPKLA